MTIISFVGILINCQPISIMNVTKDLLNTASAWFPFHMFSLSQTIPFETLLLQLLKKKANNLSFSLFTHFAFCFCILFGTFVPLGLQEIKKPCLV